MSPPLTNDGSDTRPSRSRRGFLFGVASATGAVAGCIGDSETGADGSTDNSTDRSTKTSFEPVTDLSYGEWLTAASSGLLFAYADLNAVTTSINSSAQLDESLEDPLVRYPLVLNQAVTGVGQLRLSFAGLTSAIAPEAESESTVGEVTVLNRTTVAEGSFATAELNDRLVEPTNETWGIAYEQTDQVRGFDRYEPSEIPSSFDDNPPVVAVSDEAVVVGPDTGRIKQLITTGNKTDDGFFETNEAVTKLFELAGAGDLVVGEIGARNDNSLSVRETFDTDPQFEPRASEDVLASLTFEDSGDTVSSQFALRSDDLTESRSNTLEKRFGAAAVEGSVSVESEDSRITADGTYDLESLGLTNKEGPDDEELSQTKAAELVSPDALAFQYEPLPEQEFSEFWVAVTQDTDAAALRVEAASGGYTEIQPQERPVGTGDSVAVQVDPEGDSVTVFAVNSDGVAGEVTSHSVPTEELSGSEANQAVPAEALSFSYEPPESGDYGSLTVEVVSDVGAETLVAQPQNAPGVFTDHTGSLIGDETIDTGTKLETAVDTDGDEVIIYATVDDATGEVSRWEGPQ